MANTVISLKKSATPAATPSALANGELAINYADGKLFYKAANGTIVEFASGGTESSDFGTINVGGTLLVSDVQGDILTITAGDNIVLTPDAGGDSFSISAPDVDNAFAAANTAQTDATNAFGKANTAGTDAVNAFSKANTACTKADTAQTTAVAAFAKANTNATNISGANTFLQSYTDTAEADAKAYANSTFLANTTGTFAGKLTTTNDIVSGGGQVAVTTASTRSKYLLYGESAVYALGMQSGITYGGLGDWSMTFQFNDSATRGFWWGDDAHSTAQGAMALTTEGKLTVAHSIRVGYGESDTTTPGATYAVDVNGSVNASALLVNGSPISGGGGAYFSGNNGDTGEATGLGDIFRVHSNTLTQNVTIYSGNNALAAGPVTVDSGKAITIQTGARMVIA